jgi:hypothetical protein
VSAPDVDARAVSAPVASAADVSAPDVDARAASAPVASAPVVVSADVDAQAAASEVSAPAADEAPSRLAESELVPPEPPPAELPDDVDERPAGRASRPEDDGNGAAIARAIADAKRAAVRECFERELKQQPKLAGTVVVELELAAPDRVEALRVSDDLERPAFTRCVTAAMQTVRFAALDEDVSVRVPYALSPTLR